MRRFGTRLGVEDSGIFRSVWRCGDIRSRQICRTVSASHGVFLWFARWRCIASDSRARFRQRLRYHYWLNIGSDYRFEDIRRLHGVRLKQVFNVSEKTDSYAKLPVDFGCGLLDHESSEIQMG